MLPIMPQAEDEKRSVAHGGQIVVKPLQRWRVTTLFSPDTASHADHSPSSTHHADLSEGIALVPLRRYPADSDRVSSLKSNSSSSEEFAEDGGSFGRRSGGDLGPCGQDQKGRAMPMERVQVRSGGDRGLRSRDRHGNQTGLSRVGDSGVGGGYNGYSSGGGGGFDGSEGEYERWRMRTANHDVNVTDRTFTEDENDEQWKSRKFSDDDLHHTTFSDNSLSRRWVFNSDNHARTSPTSETSKKWRASFEDSTDLRTNIDDLIKGMAQEDRWSFALRPHDGPVSRHSTTDAWTPLATVKESSAEFAEDNTIQGNHGWGFETARHDSEDTDSVDTASTDTETAFRKEEEEETVFGKEEEEEALNEQRRQFLKEMALRGKGHAIDRLTSGPVPTRRNRQQKAETVLPHQHNQLFEDTEDPARGRLSSMGSREVPVVDQAHQMPHYTLPTTDRQGQVASGHHTQSPQEEEIHARHGNFPKRNSEPVKPLRNLPKPHVRSTNQYGASSVMSSDPQQRTDAVIQGKDSPMPHTDSRTENTDFFTHHRHSPTQHRHSDSPRQYGDSPVRRRHSPTQHRHSDSPRQYGDSPLRRRHSPTQHRHSDSPRQYGDSPLRRRHSPEFDDPLTRESTEVEEGWGVGREGEEDSRAEHQRRLDAWVWSIQTHWDSTGSAEFPYSFEDNFTGLGEDGTDIFCDFPELEYEDHEVELFMTDDDKRFGFSVIGGYDEGIAPRVDDITMGSPADRAGLEVGDEIMEVNGKSVHRCAHAEIISHIHQCIRSKSIRLRVKRLKEGEKVPAISKVHDAYIIAVEESARRKLEDASANHRVVPVDMTKSPPLQKEEEAVTAFRGAQLIRSSAEDKVHSQSQAPQQQSQQHTAQQNLVPSQATKSRTVSPTKPPRQLNLQQKLQSQQQQSKQDPEVKAVDSVEDPNSMYAPSMPVSEKNRKSSPSKNGGLNGSVEALEMNGMMMERERDSPRKGKGKGKKGERGSKAISNPDTLLIEDMINQGGLAPNGKSSSHNSLNHSSNDLSMYNMDSETGFQHSPDNSFSDSGPHREMAIDCPESFVATVKTPPRYPPPNNSSSTSVPRVPPTTPSKNADSVRDQARTEATLSDAALVVAGVSQPKPTPDQLERLRKHQEELRKRREEENRQQLEQDFLRTSLRGSKKLQALENRRMAQGQQAAPPACFVNTAFEDAEEDEEGELVDDMDAIPSSTTQPVPTERYLKKNAGVEDLLSTLHHIRSRLNSADNTSSGSGSQEVFFLKQLFHNAQFQQAVAMHQRMVDVTSRSPQPRPLGTDSQDLVVDVSSCPPVRGSEPAVKELVTLLNKPLMKNLLKAHDEVAERQTHPILHTSESDLIDYPLVQYGEESVKIIHLEKTNEHLGATVKNEGDSVIIARIVKGGAAEKSGLLHEGDEILDVNGIDMRGKNVNEVSEILANMSGTITFMIIPAHACVEEPTAKPGEIMHLRALFNYDPEDDRYIPCRELGISFLKGDILHAIQLTDPNWWQAHREGEEDHHMLAGLIPSKSFQEQRESIRQQLNAESKENKKRSRMCACGRKERKKKKKKKALYNGGVGEDSEEVLTYEEVTRYYPQPNRKRPIILVGPPDVGRQELRERIMESDFDRFAAAVPHTSRPPGAGEQHAKDYFFISRPVFEADTLSGKFIEYGEFQGNLYGTSVEAIRHIILQGRICILNLHPESLKQLRETDLKPYVIFISPPNMEKLRQLQMALGKPRPTDDQLKEVIERGREIEEAYSHYFDYVLVNMDLDRSFEELLQEINRIETEPQWVPITWVNNYM